MMLGTLAGVSAAGLGLIAVIVVAPAQAADGEYVRTQSGRTHCYVSTENVACETGEIGFLNAPMLDAPPDHHFHIAAMTADGDFEWVNANLGGADPAGQRVLTYGAPIMMYGWTIVATENGTLFTDDATQNAMFVSVGQTYPVP